MTRKDGGTAFPMQDPQAIHAYAQAATEAAKHDNVEDRDQTYLAARAEAIGGMSLRDYFAAKAMESLTPVYWEDFESYESGAALIKFQCETAYEMADAMLAARSA